MERLKVHDVDDETDRTDVSKDGVELDQLRAELQQMVSAEAHNERLHGIEVDELESR